VKKSLRIIGLLNISILYCFVISLYSGHTFGYNPDFSKLTNSKTESYYSVVTANLFCHTTQTESSVNVFPVTSLKTVAQQFSVCGKITEQLLFNVFSQYRFYSQNVLTRFTQTDIIFPFHYFW
jgi:hypothetical protein